MSTTTPIQPIPDDPPIQVEKSPIETSSIATSDAKTTGTRHRRSASDIKPTSPAARRMSMSATPQSMKGRLPSEYGAQRVFRRLSERPQLGMAAVLSLIVLSATAYSTAHSLALDTSLYPTPSRTAYFAQKTNLFNQYGVKLAWLHTSLIYLSRLFSSPSDFLPRLWAYSLSTLFWGVFTTWFFGRGIGDRIIELSGGKCVIALPKEWGLDRETVGEMMKIVPSSVGASLLESTLDATSASLADTANIPPTDDNLYLAVPSGLCTTHLPLTPKSYPDIFSIISNLPFPASTYTDTDKPTLSIPKPRWYRGHDISGHIFILVLSTLLLTRELLPTWRRWLGSSRKSRQTGPNDSLRSSIHTISTLLGTALVGLWIWMTLMTSIYFHNPQEKLSGLALGLLASFIVDLLTPRSTRPAVQTRSTTPVYPQSKASVLDENRARRGSVVDDGKVIELEPAAEIDEVEGKEKVE